MLRAHLVRRAEVWPWSSLGRRTQGDPKWTAWLSDWPVDRPRDWGARVDRPQAAVKLEALWTLLRQLRQAFPGTPVRVRVDGGFAGNDWLDFLETERVEYVVGLANNPRLERRAGRRLGEAYGLSKYSGCTEHVYGETLYAAQSWSHRRRVIIKAEVGRLPGRGPHCNPRFMVTNLRETPAAVYAIYCQRGDMVNLLCMIQVR